ncbi:hypothetical protein [Mycobacteroides abscessus]|uniref:hypothetical protein n=1 Tax=Mycobacteroides abscessus TaxID=36809 RepID=UPI00092C10B8|nr:hypothetical protein [Mycobacteroides abscessus]SHQ27864.1 Uncharacterised protein [Mycobacteroides abscessus subsp. abscessus]SHS96507.1 Uncharacterised protein [Mycobacteroides abscessus subsp. abscessus]SHT27797.1 Uncharacterised protein [Mycobacteroides abscessus subsp. abscessus]SKE76707.1 Uncharacterised protein [Mycobacteroides abscessus subsp. abscessus]SKG27764.1 Uncharacterised protein [Mycobacteroides abscessus subsp. abscessus]
MSAIVTIRFAALALTAALVCGTAGCGEGGNNEPTASAATTTPHASTGDLRGRTDDELKSLMPAESEFPVPVQTDTGQLNQNPPPAGCSGDPFSNFGSNFRTVVSLFGSSDHGKTKDDLIGVGLYRATADSDVVSSVSDYIARCPQYSYVTDFGQTITIRFEKIAAPDLGGAKSIGYKKYYGTRYDGTFYVAQNRGLVVDAQYQKDADPAIADKLFRSILDNIAKA